MRAIGLIPNLDKKRAVRVAKWLVNWLGSKNVDTWMEYEAAQATEWPDRGCSFEQLVERSEIIVALGGDGTLLNAARTIAPSGTPVFGINLGHLGFLTEIEVPEIVDAFNKLLKGEYHLEERILLEARVIRRTKEEHRFIAFNDVVITKSGLTRIIQLQIFIDGKYVDSYSADGLIIASPTGSTAYSLSAGGPIVSPYVDSLIITPICPHTLHARSLIISSSETVQVVVKSLQTDVTLTGDGQHDFTLKSDDKIEIKRAKYVVKLVKLREKDFYRLLRTRLIKRVD